MSAAGARSAAASLLRVLGGDAVVLRFSSPLPGNTDAEELGLPSPEFRDVVLRPALVRSQQGRTTVLVEASTAEAVLETADLEATLLSAALVAVDGQTLQVDSLERRSVFGRAYLYRLVLQAVERKGEP